MLRLTDLREILRYVPRFRDRVFVIALDGAVVEDDNFGNLLLDIALLRSLRIGVALVHGAGHQIRRQAEQTGKTPSNTDGTGVTDAATLELARIIRDCCTHLEGAVRGCRTLQKVEEIQKHLGEIRRLENHADKIYRETDSRMFANPPDLLQLIKDRELYGWLEETVDACKDVADVMSEIVIKGT